MAFFQAKHVWIKQLTDGVAVLILDREHSPVNYLDPAMLDDVERALDVVIQTDGIRLLVIRSGKTANFCHGPSPSLLASWKKDDFLAWSERGQKLCGRLAEMPIASACVIAGSCHDAGLELALACDHRVVVDLPSTALGFPALEWGMVPCWGGTQRLPRLIGLDNSLQLLLTGQKLDAREAWRCGLADDLANDVDEDPPAFLANPLKRDWSGFPRRNWRERCLESNRLGRWFLFRGAERIVRTRIPEEMIAPAEMLNAVRQIYQQPSFLAGLEFERETLARIVEHPALRNLLRLLLHREQLRLPSIGSAEKSRIRQIGIIGSGTTGLSLYLHSVTKGYDVVLRTEDKEALAMAVLQLNQILEMEVQRGTMTQRRLGQILGGFRGTYTWTHFDQLHMVLDTTEGTLAGKQSVYQELEKHVRPDTLLVPITSLYRVEDLRHGLEHPERMIGLHLIEPWNRGSLAEIVATGSAAQPHAQRVREWAVALGKCCLPVPDRIGGAAMRVWLPALNEAGLLVKEGVPIDRIDQAMRRFGMSYGPLEWMDRLGIDLIASLALAMKVEFAGRIIFESGFSRMVEKGWLGNKSGRGFYQEGFRKRKPHREAARLCQTQSQGETIRAVPVLSEADAHVWIQGRLVTLIILEAVRCLEDGVVKDSDDLDCALCLTGWASHRGGPISHARQLGAEAVTARCLELAREHGLRFAPVASLATFLSR